MLLVGWLFVGAFAASTIGSGVAYRADGFTGRFWALALDDKLHHLHTRRRQWRWLSTGHIVALVSMTAGVTGLVAILVETGQGTIAFVGFGIYLVALVAWTIGLIAQTATLPMAASVQAETGATPTWINAFWSAGYLAEAIWVIGGNLAYAVFGWAILQSDLLADWAGWAAIGLGLGIPAAVAITRYGFPELTQVVPLILGIALIVTAPA